MEQILLWTRRMHCDKLVSNIPEFLNFTNVLNSLHPLDHAPNHPPG
jgi:hypothetical protein